MSAKALAAGIGAGAGLMYLLDPDRGRRRRAIFRDKVSSGVTQSGHGLGKTWRDVANRSRGTVAAARAAINRGAASDDVLVARVRSRIGRVASHPHALRITARDGRVSLEGPAFSNEVERIVASAKSVAGVREVENRIEAHAPGSDIPALQGGVDRPGRRWEAMQSNWTPAFRAAAGVAGGWLLLRGLLRGGFSGTFYTLAGGGILLRAATNTGFRSLVGVGERCCVDVQKAINIHAPVERVYAFWTNYQNFPRFMTHLKEVRDLGGGRSHWIAEGPGGVPVGWDAEIHQMTPNRLLAWSSVPGSRIENSGSVRFDPNPDGSTRITVRLRYSPPAGMLGHVVASLFRRDPKHEIEDDLARLKSLIEYGKTRAHGETVRRDELNAPAPL